MSKNVTSDFLKSPQKDQEDQLTIQKSLPMLSLWRSSLTLAEFKILDLYLSRIDSHHPEKRSVRFRKGELEHLLGVQRIRTEDLKERMRHLCTSVELPDVTKTGGFIAISLFERAACFQDENGLWQIDLECTPTAMKYIFNIDNIGYLRYRLHSICSLSSRYSYILFLYMERNRFRKTWEEDIELLREMLGCDEEYYKAFKRFNQQILQRCQEELREKADFIFTYEPLKAGRFVRRIRFTIEPVSLSDSPKEAAADFDAVTKDASDFLEFLRGACCIPGENGHPEFSRAEMTHLLRIMEQVPPNKLPSWTPGGDYKFALYHYLAERYAALNRRAEVQKINNRLGYLIAMLRKDAGIA